MAAPQFPDQPEQPAVAAGIGPDPGHVRVMGQQRAEDPVAQDLQLPVGIALFQGADGRGGEHGVPQGGGADEQDPPDLGRVEFRQGPGRPPAHPALQVPAGAGQQEFVPHNLRHPYLIRVRKQIVGRNSTHD